MTLPTFRADATCPKCAGDQVSVSYLTDTEHACQSVYAPLEALPQGASAVCWYYSGEHLHRTCARCRYRWAEAVVSPGATSVPQPVVEDTPDV